MRVESWGGGGAAAYSDCGTYRYVLERRLSQTPRDGGFFVRRLVFVMLNPSTASAKDDDPTIRRCVGFAQRWGYDRLHVVNLFAYRTPHPRALRAAEVSPVGPLNDEYTRWEIEAAAFVVCAWGNEGAGAGDEWLRRMRAWSRKFHHLGLTKHGHPKHPLARGRHRIPDDVKPQQLESPE